MDPDVEDVNRTIDGNNDPNFQHGSCVETPGINDFEWWTVDLEWNHIIQRLRVVAGRLYSLTAKNSKCQIITNKN